MANELIDAVKAYSEQTLASGKKLGEINLKLLDSFSKKQADYLKTYVDFGTKQSENFAKVKDLNELVSLQQTTSQQFNEQWIANLRETAALLESARHDIVAITEEALHYTKNNTATILEIGKKIASNNAEKTSEAFNKATTEFAELSKKTVDHLTNSAQVL